jgi:4-amino-4-deoxy-L-arabinose transferase-like glycosyltransferase
MAITASGQNTQSEVRHYGWLLLWCVLAALAVRFVVIAFAYPSFLVPERDHWLFGFEAGKIARSIVTGHGFGNPYYGGNTGPTAELGPVLPYIMAGVFAVFGIYTKASAIAMLGVNSLFSALTCIPIFFVAKKSFGLNVARWAMWAWAFFPYAIYFATDSMWDHVMIALLLTCIFWASVELQDSSSLAAWAGFGLLCGFTALANAVVLSVLPFLGGWSCYQLHKKGKRYVLQALLAGILAFAVVVPWMIRNYRVFHAPVFLRDNFALTFVTGNVGNSLHWWNASLDPSGNPAEMDAFHRLGELRYMAEKAQQEHQYLREHPGVVVLRSVRRFIYMWTGFWSFNRTYLQEENFDLYNIPFCTALTVLAFIGFWKMYRKNPESVVPYAILLVVFPLVYYVANPEMGYREAYDPELVILICCAIVAWRSPKRKPVADPEPELASQSSR